MPKPGKGIISKEEDIFNKKEIFVSGIFPGNDQLNNYIIAPLELTAGLLNLPKNSAYQIVIKIKKSENADILKENLLKKLGNNIIIKTKAEENAAFWKMINMEKLMIYFIFALVIFITTFNLAGAVTILQLDKNTKPNLLFLLVLRLMDFERYILIQDYLLLYSG
jgi:lipoprotein-releasing system permease protein